MKSKIFLQLITAVFAFFVFCTSAYANPVPENEAADWINRTGIKLIEALGNPDKQAKYAVLDDMFKNDVDTAYIAQFVLGRYWRMLNAEQKARYQTLFYRYVVSLYKTYPLNFDTKGLDFTITSTRVNDKYTDVFCRVQLPENLSSEALDSLLLEFKLTQTENRIRIVDLKIGESSLLLTYRNRFNTMVKDVDEDMDWFLEDFTDLTASTEKQARQQ